MQLRAAWLNIHINHAKCTVKKENYFKGEIVSKAHTVAENLMI